jgi:hypothetical protein
VSTFFHPHLPFANHMHDLDARQNDARTPKILEAHHRFDDTFDGPVILFDNVIQVLALANPDRRFPLGIDGLKRCKVGPAFIYGDRLWRAVLVDRVFKISSRGNFFAGASDKFFIP